MEIKTETVDDQGLWYIEDISPGEETWNIIVSEWKSKFSPFVKNFSRKGTVVQAGAWQGVYPKLLAQHFKKVICFEPDTTNYKICLKNLDLDHRVTCINAALGGRIGLANLEITETTGQHRIKDPHLESFHLNIKDSKEVNMITIDSLDLTDCDLIMLDVENYELPVISGASDTIKKHLPVVIFEKSYWPDRDREIDRMLTDLGYTKTHDWIRDLIYQHKEQIND